MRRTLSGCLGAFTTLVIFGLIGGGLTIWGWTILRDARASANWPTATGTISRSEVTRSSDAEGGDSYSPKVTYQYQIDGQSFSNYQIKFGENSYGSERKAQEIAANYPVGRQVTVYYDPEQPTKSVLEPGVTAGSYIVISIGALFLLISLIVPPLAFIFGRK